MSDPTPPSDEPGRAEVTELLDQLRGGDERAMDRLLPLVYGELRRIARGQRRRNVRPSDTLGTTALVHEAYLKLARHADSLQNRDHFFAVAATAMRQLLVDRARRHLSDKRGGGAPRLSLDDEERSIDQLLSDDGDADRVTAEAHLVVDLDRALRALEQQEPRYLRVVECKFFAGMTAAETAVALGTSERTVRRDWLKARVWLELYLQPESGGAAAPG